LSVRRGDSHGPIGCYSTGKTALLKIASRSLSTDGARWMFLPWFHAKGSIMRTTPIAKQLALPVICCGLLAPAQAGEESRDKRRAGLDDLSHEMCTCAAYFSLLSSVIANSAGAETKAGAAERIKSIGQAMLSQGINVASYIGVDEKLATKRVQIALKEMVETINGDPANSLRAMHTKYGLPCDALRQEAPQRFIALLQPYEAD
jgi:hypothetical protein